MVIPKYAGTPALALIAAVFAATVYGEPGIAAIIAASAIGTIAIMIATKARKNSLEWRILLAYAVWSARFFAGVAPLLLMIEWMNLDTSSLGSFVLSFFWGLIGVQIVKPRELKARRK